MEDHFKLPLYLPYKHQDASQMYQKGAWMWLLGEILFSVYTRTRLGLRTQICMWGLDIRVPVRLKICC